MAIEANHLSPVDVTIPLAQSALELLSWAVLVEREHWLSPSVELDAGHRIRLLLRWAGIPTEIPPQLADAAAHAANCGSDDFDGPRVVTSVRNRVIHPPRRRPEWPSHELQIDAWRLALGYIELVVLRLCGYEGMYASRHHIGGRWVGTVDPVPWVGDDSRQLGGG